MDWTFDNFEPTKALLQSYIYCECAAFHPEIIVRDQSAIEAAPSLPCALADAPPICIRPRIDPHAAPPTSIIRTTKGSLTLPWALFVGRARGRCGCETAPFFAWGHSLRLIGRLPWYSNAMSCGFRSSASRASVSHAVRRIGTRIANGHMPKGRVRASARLSRSVGRSIDRSVGRSVDWLSKLSSREAHHGRGRE